jgi:CheY-like chemotaxis protein
MWLSDWFKKGNVEPALQPYRPRILALSLFVIDRLALERLGQLHEWELRFTDSPKDAFRLAGQKDFELILCCHSQPGYPWREVMDRLAERSPRSRILLVSPAKDDFLWCDVVQHGGYDVLTCPLRESDVVQSMNTAILSPVASCLR